MISKVFDCKAVTTPTPLCAVCADEYSPARRVLGYSTCLPCGEKNAREVRHTIAPMPKSNYMVFTDMSLLKGLNTSHKGGIQ